ncbi:DUF6232 family protein [Streptomyces sp. NPDC085466]|uniref:DUF6232 family protein n=1 Tax=Streptomyces sp. NPDC085466 TaxID=3365725 RepID=UPI0037D46D89
MTENGPPRPPVPPAPSTPPPAPPPGNGPLELRVARRLLWIGGAFYPLENVVRVYTFVLRPRRAEAVRLFARRLARLMLASLLVLLLGELGAFGSPSYDSYGNESGPGGLQVFVWLVIVGILVYSFVEMMTVVGAASHLTLAIETNGASTALVAGSPEQLHRLVHQLAHAVEHPDSELLERVGSLPIGNPGNYYFGDVVNMYGGTGNRGIQR